jgi:hypothetical protein
MGERCASREGRTALGSRLSSRCYYGAGQSASTNTCSISSISTTSRMKCGPLLKASGLTLHTSCPRPSRRGDGPTKWAPQHAPPTAGTYTHKMRSHVCFRANRTLSRHRRMTESDPQLTSDASGPVARRASMGSRIKRDIYRTEDYAVGQNHSKRHHRRCDT